VVVVVGVGGGVLRLWGWKMQDVVCDLPLPLSFLIAQDEARRLQFVTVTGSVRIATPWYPKP
jgi:hypothetical protein